MSKNLHNRSFLSLWDYAPDEIAFLLNLATDLKQAKAAATEVPRLTGKEIALIFEKESTRIRVGFEVSGYDPRACVTYLGPSSSHLGKKQTVKDTARVLGRVFDAIEYRGFGPKIVGELAEWADVPVYIGLTDEFHPTQILADLLTMGEHCNRPLSQIAFCFPGDTGNNMGDSLMIGGVPTCDFLYTDVLVSMGEADDIWAKRIDAQQSYQVNTALMARTDYPDSKFMHCLPAFHNTHTEVGARIAESHGLEALEVTDEAFEFPASIVFDQAENRMHTIKAMRLLVDLGAVASRLCAMLTAAIMASRP